MSASTVYSVLKGFIPSSSGPDTIDLWQAANGSEDLAGMIPILGLFGIDSSYIVSSVVLTLSPSETGVSLTGTGTFSNPNATTTGTTYNVTISLYYTDDNGFSLIFNIVGNWKFLDFFGELPETMMSDPEGGVGITWYPSILAEFTISGAIFSGRTGTDEKLNLNGTLLEPSSAYIVDKIPMVSPWPLSISGALELATIERIYPLLELDARGNNTIITAQQEDGVQGPAIINLEDPGITLIIAALIPEQPDKIAFSTVELFGDFALGDIKGRISTLIYSTGSLWNFTVIFDKDTASLVQGLAQLTAIFGVELTVPMNFPVLKDFYVAQVDMDLQNSADTGKMPSFTLQNLGVTILSDKEWNPPIPFVTLSNVGTRWVWGWTVVNDTEKGGTKKTYTLNGSVFGTLNIGGSSAPKALPESPTKPVDRGGLVPATTDPVKINVKMSLPNFIINGSLDKDSYIPIGNALNFYFGNSGPSTGIQTMNIVGLNFSADPIGQNYYADASILFGDPEVPDAQQGWKIDLYVLTIILNELEFYIRLSNGNVFGGINGTFFLVQGDPSDYTLPRIILSAEYPPQDPTVPEGWTLSGYLYPGTSISLTTLVYQFIYGENTNVPDWVPDLTVDRLAAKFTTGSGTTQPSYTFGGTISARWSPEIFGTTLKINASASMDMEKLSTSDTATGKLSGMFSVNKMSVTASLTFGVPEPTYLFKVQFDELWLQATTAWRGESANRHQVVSLQLGGVTLGDMLEYLVNLAAPTLGFKLDSPWDVLKQVDLSQFVLTIDPQENIVEFVFNTNVNIVVAQLKSIGVRYSKKGSEGKVDLILTGSFLGQKYGDEDPLAWDVINDPPPSVPGDGISLIDLRYLGIGQHVTFKGDVPDTVAESIQKLRDDMTPVDSEGNPMPDTMQYSSGSQWLIGLDLTIMETVDFSFIFNDPVLYGLSLGLKGEKAGGLAGLRFEILYKKITDDIGVFRVEFQVPDMFRTIQLGVASITLGIIVVEIYTNGNFKVDLGFPYNRNYDRAFSLQAYIFIGRGGFYLGVLNGDTSTQVPRISNGNFSPVIELGVGMAAGVGREIRKGVLSGGAYVQLEVLFEGVLAWFNPTSNGTASATFFKCTGVAALHGKVYGSIDFKVIKVSITLEAYAQVVLIYECYQPLLIDLSVDVRASASVKILFIKVHFSFHVNLDLSFTVGSASPTPWILDNTNESSGDSSVFALNSGRTTESKRGRSRSYYLRANKHRRKQALRNTYILMHKKMRESGMLEISHVDGTAVSEGYLLNWQPEEKVFPDAPRYAHMTVLPLFTVGNVPVNWDATIPTNDSPDYRTAFVLFADSGIDADAKTAAACKTRTATLSGMASSAEDTSSLAADILVQGLTKYAIDALPRGAEQGNDITAGQLELLIEQLDMPETLSIGFSIENLEKFFKTNINLWISGDPGSTPDEKGAMTLPMPPFLSWTSPQGGDVDFKDKNSIGTLYEWEISQFLNSYFSMGTDGTDKPTDDDPSNYESFTSFMFRDFCLMMVQSAILEMQKHMDDTNVTVTEVSGVAQTLSQVADGLPQTQVNYAINSGDTVENVAETLGATVEEIEFLNPNLAVELVTKPVGTVIPILLGIAPEVLAIDNPDEAFAMDQCILGTLVHQAAQNDTLGHIASLFQVPDVATLLSYHNPTYLDLSSGSQILNPDTTLSLATQTFTNAPTNNNALRTAGIFFTRYFEITIYKDSLVPEMANWYTQAISELNDMSNLYPDQVMVTDLELPPNQILIVPDGYNNKTNTNPYTTVNGDSLSRIGIALTLQQDYGTTSSPNGVPEWETFQQGVVSAGENAYTIPAKDDIAIRTAESIEDLVRRLMISATWVPQNIEEPTSGSWTYNWSAVAVWISDAEILLPLASITIPDAKTGVHTPLNFSVIAKTYGVSIVDAAGRLKADSLYATGTVLKVTLLPAQDIDVLLDLIVQGNSFASIINQSSRMLMSGLQLPGLKDDNDHVVADLDNPLPLYDLTGQQFDLTVDDQQPLETALALDLASNEDWITLMNSITVTEGDTLEDLETEYPDLLEYNPGLNEETFTVGIVLLTGPVSATLDYIYTNQYVLDNSPETGLSIVPVSSMTPPPTSPTPLALSATVIKTYGLEKSILLQTPVILPIPQVAGQENVSGNPTLWPFPSDMINKAKAGVSTKYETLYSKADGAAGNASVTIEDTTYGMLLPFKIKRLEDNSTNQFALIGVDTDTRNTLIALMDWLNQQSETDQTKAYALLSPAPNATNTSGLTILSTQPDDIYLIKSNLSAESAPPTSEAGILVAEEDTSVYFSSMETLANFVMLLWEGSVVGGTGYYLGTTQDLPSSAFDDQGNITLQLLVIAGTQQAIEADGRSLLPFNNCVLLAPGVDNELQTLYLESADSTDVSEITVQAVVPPGNVGFELLTQNPDAQIGSVPDKETQLKSLYSLLSFEVKEAEGSPFYATASGMPVLPDPSDGSSESPAERARNKRKAKQNGITSEKSENTPEAYNSYKQVLPVSNFVLTSVVDAAPDVNGLPAPANDPYHGFGTETTLPSAAFVFGFGDVLGNRTGVTGADQGETIISVGYTDAIIGIAEWPSIARYFEVNSNGSGSANVTIVISARPSELLPTPSQRGDVNADNMIQQSQKYSDIYYQLVQSRMEAWLVTSLKVVADLNYENKGIQIADMSLLYRFAAGSYANINSLIQFTATKPIGISSLGDIMSVYGVRYTELAQANADSPLLELFGSTLPTVPGYYPFVEYQSIAELYTLPPTGWPLPASAEDLLTDPENTSLLLRIGVLLSIPSGTLTTDDEQPTKPLQDLADENHTDPLLLAVNNQEAAILENGFEFEEEVSDDMLIVVTVDASTNSFSLVRDKFIEEGVHLTVEDLAQSNKDKSGMFKVSEPLNFDNYVTQEDDTLAANNSGASVNDLASLNVNTTNIFDPGALVYFGVFAATLGDSSPTLQEFGDRYACPLELLLQANDIFVLPATTSFVVPGTVSWPEVTNTLRTPYTIAASDTLNGISGKFSKADGTGDANDLLAALNENMPSTLLSNIDLTIEVSGTNYSVNTGDDNPSFASVLTALQQQVATATLDDIVSSIGDETDVLNLGGLFICPPAQLTQQTAPKDIEGLYGVTAATFALGNTAIQHIIVPGLTLSSVDGTTITTQENDTFNSLITRFADNGASVDVPEIVNENAAIAMFESAALALLPASEIQFTSNIGTGGPYLEPITPLTTSIRIIRPSNLIYPEFTTSTGNGPVEMVESAIPAPIGNENTENGALNFNDFVEALEGALPNVRLGTGQADGVPEDLWTVNFDDQGIKSVALVGDTSVSEESQPRFFALAPLYKHLVTRPEVTIKPLKDDGSLGDPENISFQSIDTEVWARKFVEDFDRFLDGVSTISLYNSESMRPYLTQVLDC